MRSLPCLHIALPNPPHPRGATQPRLPSAQSPPDLGDDDWSLAASSLFLPPSILTARLDELFIANGFLLSRSRSPNRRLPVAPVAVVRRASPGPTNQVGASACDPRWCCPLELISTRTAVSKSAATTHSSLTSAAARLPTVLLGDTAVQSSGCAHAHKTRNHPLSSPLLPSPQTFSHEPLSTVDRTTCRRRRQPITRTPWLPCRRYTLLLPRPAPAPMEVASRRGRRPRQRTSHSS